MTFKLGVSNDEKGGFKKKNIWSLKDGVNIYRILPPMFSLADKGIWSKFYRVEYGYKDSKGHLKPFLDVRVVNGKTKMVEVESAAHVKREKLKAQLEHLKASGAAAETIEKMTKIVKEFNQDSKHHVNAMNQSGEIGMLKIPHRAKEALDELIKELKAGGVDPRSAENGRFFVFKRSGFGLSTLHTVSVLKENIDVPGVGLVEKPVVHKLDDSILARLPSEAFDLDKLYLRLSPEEVEAVVNGTPDVLDAILAAKSGKAVAESSEEEEDGFDDVVESDATAFVAPTVSTGLSNTQPTQPVAPKTNALNAKNMTDEEFLKSLGGL